MKNIIRCIILIPLALYLIYCLGYTITMPMNPTYKDCGKVLSKGSDEVTIKYGVRTNLYLNIQFDKTGFKSQQVDPTTYFGSKVGDTKCFNLVFKPSIWHDISWLIGFITITVVIGIVIFKILDFIL